MNKKILKIIGTLLMIISFIFIIKKIIKYDLGAFQFSIIQNHIIKYSFLCIALGGIIIISGILFRQIVCVISNVKVSKKQTTYTYCKANLYKYIPSNVVQYIGRNQIALDNNQVSYQQVIVATIVEIVFLVTTSLLVALCFAYQYGNEIIIKYDLQNTLWIIGGIAVISIPLSIILILQLKRKHKSYLQNLYEQFKKIIYKIPIFVFFYFIVYILNGLFFLVVLSDFCGENIVISQLGKEVIGLYALSWVLGYITPGAPGGLGIRESIMCLFLADDFTENVILSAVLVHRLLTILGDIVAFIILFLISKKIWKGKKNDFNDCNTYL